MKRTGFGLVTTAAVGLAACSGDGEHVERVGTSSAAVVGVDTHLYFRCNATGWGVDDVTRLVQSSSPGSFTLVYEVSEPWMVTGSDTCTVTETNQLNGWGTRQTAHDLSGDQLLTVPDGDAVFGQLTTVRQGSDFNFGVRYPEIGRFRVTVHAADGELRIEKEGAGGHDGLLPGDVNGDGSVTAVDGLLVAQYVAGGTPSPFDPVAAEVNCDGQITSEDASLIGERVVGLRQYLPFCLGTRTYTQIPYSHVVGDPENHVIITTYAQWGGGYCANVSLHNPGELPTSGWTAEIELGGATFSTAWNADASVNGSVLILEPQSHTETIPAFGAVQVGYCAARSAPSQQPSATGWSPFWEFLPANYRLYKSPHWSLFSHRDLAGHALRVLDAAERCFEISASIAGPEWASAADARYDSERKTLAYVPSLPLRGGHGNGLLVETPLANSHDLTQLGSSRENWIFYYEMHRGFGGPWEPYLVYGSALDWNSAFAHSVAITCSEDTGGGPHHENVEGVKRALTEWIGMPSPESWVDKLESNEPDFVGASGDSFPVHDAYGAMLAELYRLHGFDYFQRLLTELTTGGYPFVNGARDQACNLLLGTDAVTGGTSHDLMVNDWRFPDDC